MDDRYRLLRLHNPFIHNGIPSRAAMFDLNVFGIAVKDLSAPSAQLTPSSSAADSSRLDLALFVIALFKCETQKENHNVFTMQLFCCEIP